MKNSKFHDKKYAKTAVESFKITECGSGLET